MQRTIVLNDLEPAPMSFRQPVGVPLDLMLLFRSNTGAVVDPTGLKPQLALVARSTGFIGGFDVTTYNVANGIGRVQMPGHAIGDPNGYSMELYQRIDAANPADPPVPIALIGAGVLTTMKGIYHVTGPFAPITVPTVIGPPGPAGPTGAIGPTGHRGSIWTTGSGAPGTTGTELSGDMYLDESNGDVYRWNGTAWTLGAE